MSKLCKPKVNTLLKYLIRAETEFIVPLVNSKWVTTPSFCLLILFLLPCPLLILISYILISFLHTCCNIIWARHSFMAILGYETSINLRNSSLGRDSAWRYFSFCIRKELSEGVTDVFWIFALQLSAAIFQKRLLSSLLKNAVVFLRYSLRKHWHFNGKLLYHLIFVSSTHQIKDRYANLNQ